MSQSVSGYDVCFCVSIFAFAFRFYSVVVIRQGVPMTKHIQVATCS